MLAGNSGCQRDTGSGVPAHDSIEMQPHVVAIEPRLLAAVREMAATRGLSAETLVNLWVQQQIHAVIETASRYREYG
jgi:hypothetical protein